MASGSKRFQISKILASLLLCLGYARGQSLEELRDAIRQNSKSIQLGKALSSLIDLSQEPSLSSATYRVDTAPTLHIKTIKFPIQGNLPWGNEDFQLCFDGGFGAVSAEALLRDLFEVNATGLEAHADSRWSILSARGGLGTRIRLGEGLTATPIASLGLARVENETDFSGSDANLLKLVTDKILFNWESTMWDYGGAFRLDYERRFDQLAFDAMIRYDQQRAVTLHASDAAQEVTASVERLSSRADLSGPTGWESLGVDVNWKTHLGYYRLLGESADIWGFRDYYELGAGLKFFNAKDGESAQGFRLDAAWILGEHISGWTIGVWYGF